MSNNKFRSIKTKLEEPVRKDLTPKNYKYSPKISPVFSSLRGGMTLKPDPINKIQLTNKPSTAKNSS
jgi:hypothetical protein